MKSNTFLITGVNDSSNPVFKQASDSRIKVILNETEKIAAQNDLDPKQTMHLRLLSEELMCIVPQLIQYGSATFWIENEGTTYEMHMRVTPKKMPAAPKKTDNSEVSMMKRISKAFGNAVTYVKKGKTSMWTLSGYIAELKSTDRMANSGAWDELERSIMANLADDVTVKTADKDVELIVTKEFG